MATAGADTFMGDVQPSIMSTAPSGKPTKVRNPRFDVTKYASQYKGQAPLHRLLFVGEHCDDLSAQVAHLLDTARQSSDNFNFFRAASERLRGAGVEMPNINVWAEQTSKRVAERIDRLDGELSAHRSATAKDLVRADYMTLGDAHYDSGDLQTALKMYLRARDYATTFAHSTDINLRSARVASEMGNWASVSSILTKAEQSLTQPAQQAPPAPGAPVQAQQGGQQAGQDAAAAAAPVVLPPEAEARLRIFGVLMQMQSQNYAGVARKLLDATEGEGIAPYSTYDLRDMVTPRDVAMFAGLCALATMDRQQLKKMVVDNSSFRDLATEHAPEMAQVVSDFYHTRYASCLATLGQLRPDLQLDIHLHPHVDVLLRDIRQRAIVQYCSPFLTVDLAKMAAAFHVTTAEMEHELAGLVARDVIHARIDSQAKVLHAQHTDHRTGTFEAALRVGDDFEKESAALLLRMDLVRGGFTVKPPAGVRDRAERGDRDRAFAAGPGPFRSRGQMSDRY